jgi:hypothetical protein
MFILYSWRLTGFPICAQLHVTLADIMASADIMAGAASFDKNEPRTIYAPAPASLSVITAGVPTLEMKPCVTYAHGLADSAPAVHPTLCTPLHLALPGQVP